MRVAFEPGMLCHVKESSGLRIREATLSGAKSGHQGEPYPVVPVFK